MKLFTFLKDVWRVCLLFAVSTGLSLTVIGLSHGFKRSVGLGDVLYSAFLSLTMLAVFLIVEYLLRRPYYVEVEARLQHSSSSDKVPLSSVDTFPRPGTAEQRMSLRLMKQYYRTYVNKLSVLQEQQALYEKFSARFAHQMKTPVTVIQLLEQDMREITETLKQAVFRNRPPERRTLLQLESVVDSLAEERNQLNATLSIMLETVRLHSFEMDSHMEDIDVVRLIREGVHSHKAEWLRAKVYPKVESWQNEVWVSSDKKWLRVLIDQILRNALQYGYKPESEASAGKDTHFVVTISDEEKSVRILFQDEGIGIPSRDLPRIFDPFFTGGNGRVYSRASGMGLYLAKEIANRLGHRLSVNSTEGEGTTFILTMDKSVYLSLKMDKHL